MTGGEDVGGGARFADAPQPAGDVGAAVRALAIKLGCPSVALIGCVRESVVRSLHGLKLTGEDDASIVTAARRADAPGSWRAPGNGADDAGVTGGPRTLVVVNVHLLLGSDGFERRLTQLCAESPAVALIDPDLRLGIADVQNIYDRVADAGLTLEHASFVRAERGSGPRTVPYVVISDGHDSRPHVILSTGARGLATDPIVDLGADLGRPLRVCVASYEVVGPTRNGGIGTANTSLAEALARAGHDVTLLFTGFPQDGAIDIEHWTVHYAGRGIAFVVLAADWSSWVRAPHANVRRAYEFYAWLRDRETPFDVVHFPECQGHAYFATLARRQGLAFSNTLFVAGVHSSTRWCEEANRELPRSIDALVDDHLERSSVAQADVAISPSAYMLDYMEERGWTLPDRRFVQQYILPLSDDEASAARAPTSVDAAPLEEIMFFGRLEVRKGVGAFCDALDRLAADGVARELRVTFLGRPEHILGEPSVDYLARRARAWPWSYAIEGDLNQRQALARLRRTRCLVVMPSTVDNSPNTVSEALGLGIPFVCSRSGGTGELIDPRDLHRVAIPGLEPAHGLPPTPAHAIGLEMSAEPLYERIIAALDGPVVARFAIDHHVNESVHIAWNVGAAVAHAAASDAGSPAPQPRPTVSVGLLHRDQPDGLEANLNALETQAREIHEVIVVDESVTDVGVQAARRAASTRKRLGWRFVDRRQSHAGRAREQMIAETSGDALVFLRAGESIADEAVATIRDVFARTGADVLTWPVSDPRGLYDEDNLDRGGDHRGDAPSVVVPIGGPALVGSLYPAFTIGPYAITRSALEHLRGFAPDARGFDADSELINRALLAGLRLQVVPEPLAEVRYPDPWRNVRAAATIDLGLHAWDREQMLRVARAFAVGEPTPMLQLPGLYATLVARTAEEHARAVCANAELERGRSQQAEYIAYLENEHHLLSERIHAYEKRERWSPVRRVARHLSRLVGSEG